MKKKTKILSISLAFLMSCGVMHTAIFSGYAQETTSQSVASEEKSVESVAVTKLPNKTEYTLGKDYEMDFNMLELTVAYENQTTEAYTCIKDEYDYYAWVDAEGNERYDIDINIVDIDDLVVGDNTVTVEHMGFTDEFTVTAYEVSVTKIELKKLPDKVFEAPVEDFMYVPIKLPTTNMYQVKPGFSENAISYNMAGAELLVYYSNGDTQILDFSDCIGNDKGRTFMMKYWSKGYTLCVYECGNYQAEVSVSFGNEVLSAKFTAKNPTTPETPEQPTTTPSQAPTNPEQSTTSPSQTPTNPEQSTTAPSQDATNSEQSTTKPNNTATPSEVAGDSVKTGSNFYCISVILIMLASMGVFLFFNRERYFNK